MPVTKIFGFAGRIFRSIRPVRDERYRRYVKSFPCCACKAWWHIDPAHTGPHSHGSKGCDLKVIPLCRSCHEKFDAAPVTFAAKNNLDVPNLIVTYQELYGLNFPERAEVFDAKS